jgi:dTDP-4-amino-4,6-dideoxy-D-galactose acyltransferase
MMNDACKLLAWDSEHWGFPVARISESRLSEDRANQAIHWCEEHKVKCLYFAGDGTCAETLEVAWVNRFRFVDVRVDMERNLQESVPGGATSDCREAQLEDLAALEDLARTAHKDTRFFKDLHFDRIKAGDLYALWIARDLRENTVFVAASESAPGSVLGYVSASISSDGEGRIGLVAVNSNARGRGLGRRLVGKALSWCQSRGAGSVRVATQGANVPALRLYETCGFKVADMKVWFHRWFDE